MRTQALSAMFLGGLLALTAAGQGVTVPKTTEVKKATLEDDIARAVRTHPDVQVAEAEARLAGTKLEQAKLAVAQRVAAAKREKDKSAADLNTAKSRLELVQRSLELSKLQLDRIQQLHRSGSASATEVRAAEQDYDKAKLGVLAAEQALAAEKAKLAEAEAAYDALVGKATPSLRATWYRQLVTEEGSGSSLTLLIDQNRKLKTPPTGSVAERIRAAMAKRIVFEGHDIPLAELVDGLKKAAGLDVVVRIPKIATARFNFTKQELPLSAWFELVRDELIDGGDRKAADKIDWYVRDYGLTLSEYGRPDGAMTLGEFLKAVREDAEKPRTEPAPKK